MPVFFICDILSKPHTNCYKNSSRYSIWLPTYGMHKVSLRFHQKEVTQKLGKGEQSFLYETHRLYLIHIAIKFHLDMPYGYLSYGMHKDSMGKKQSNQKEVIQKVRKGEQPFLQWT